MNPEQSSYGINTETQRTPEANMGAYSTTETDISSRSEWLRRLEKFMLRRFAPVAVAMLGISEIYAASPLPSPPPVIEQVCDPGDVAFSFRDPQARAGQQDLTVQVDNNGAAPGGNPGGIGWFDLTITDQYGQVRLHERDSVGFEGVVAYPNNLAPGDNITLDAVSYETADSRGKAVPHPVCNGEPSQVNVPPGYRVNLPLISVPETNK